MYYASRLVMCPETLSVPLRVLNPVGEPVLVDQMYRSCLVSIQRRDTRADLILLDMIYFDIILGMYCLLPYRAVLN